MPTQTQALKQYPAPATERSSGALAIGDLGRVFEQARNGSPIPLKTIQTLLETRLLPPEVLPVLGLIELAPFHYVDARVLRWHPLPAGKGEIVMLLPGFAVPPQRLSEAPALPPFPCSPGSNDSEADDDNPLPPEVPWVRLQPVLDMLTRVDAATTWHVDGDDRNASRFSAELNCLLRVTCVWGDHAAFAPHGMTMPDADAPGLRFVVRADAVPMPSQPSGYGDPFVLTDLDDAGHVPLFKNLAEGCRMADAALWREPTLPDDFDFAKSPPPPRLRWLPART